MTNDCSRRLFTRRTYLRDRRGRFASITALLFASIAEAKAKREK
jgi:hypothetical protein